MGQSCRQSSGSRSVPSTGQSPIAKAEIDESLVVLVGRKSTGTEKLAKSPEIKVVLARAPKVVKSDVPTLAAGCATETAIAKSQGICAAAKSMAIAKARGYPRHGGADAVCAELYAVVADAHVYERSITKGKCCTNFNGRWARQRIVSNTSGYPYVVVICYRILFFETGRSFLQL